MQSPTSGSPGTEIIFTLAVSNTGLVALDPVEVTDTLPLGLTYVSATPVPTTVSPDGKTLTWSNVGPLAAAGSTSIEIKAELDGAAYGSLTNNVEAEGKPPSGDAVTDTDTADVTSNPASIDIEKSATPTSGSPGTEITFTLAVSNTGSVALDPVEVTDTLPLGLTYVSATPVPTTVSADGKTLTWSNVGPLAAAGSTSIEIKAELDGAAYGSLTNNAEAEGKPPSGDAVTDTDTADVTSNPASIDIEKSAIPTSGSPGTEITFTLAVSNTGSVALDPVTVTDTLPLGLTYVSATPVPTTVSADGKTLTWSNVGPLAAAGSTSIEIKAELDGAAYGSLTNNVEAEGRPPSGDAVTDTDTADVTSDPASIDIEKSATPTSGSPGTEITFTLAVSNTGSVALDPVEVTDTLPLGLTYVSATPVPTTVSADGKTLTWSNVGPLAAAGSTSIEIKAELDGAAYGSLTNNAEAEGKPPSGDAVTDTDTADVTSNPASIDVEKSATPTSGSPGTEITFTLAVSNTGSVALDPVEVTDTLPLGLTYVSATPVPTTVSADGKTLTWSNVGPLAAAGSTSIEIKAELDGAAYGSLTNNVEAEGRPPSGDAVTDTDTADVTSNPASIDIEKSAIPTSGSPGTEITFTLAVSNTGSVALDPVEVTDTLPLGLTYVSATPVPTTVSADGKTLTWSNVGPLAAAGSTSIEIKAELDGAAYGALTNNVEAEGKPPSGDAVTDTDTADVTSDPASIDIEKSATPDIRLARHRDHIHACRLEYGLGGLGSCRSHRYASAGPDLCVSHSRAHNRISRRQNAHLVQRRSSGSSRLDEHRDQSRA